MLLGSELLQFESDNAGRYPFTVRIPFYKKAFVIRRFRKPKPASKAVLIANTNLSCAFFVNTAL